jgi:PPM family protein phosphatase
MDLAMRYSATSDVGRVRKNNQDSGFASDHLLVVADGMGGAAAGDTASAETVQVMRRLHDAHPDDILGALAGAVQRANDRLGEIIEQDPSVEGMGTTVTAVMLDGDRMALAHIGDSRAYMLRGGRLQQLTSDHTFVQGLVDEGRISESEARNHPHRSLLLRALDGRHEAEPDLTMFEVHPGDRLLVCSDGLCGYVDDAAIQNVLGSGTPDGAAMALQQMALDAGGPDNITCVVGDIVDAATPADPGSAAAAAGGPLLVGAAAEQARPAPSGGDTATQPALGRHAAGDPMAGADPEELRYAPRAPRRFGWVRRIAVLLVLLALLGAAAKYAYDWTQRQYYVADSGETVAIYRGIHAQVPLVQLSSVHEQSQVALSTLPTYWRNRVMGGIDATTLSNAHNIVRQLQDTALLCAETDGGSGGGSGSPSPNASPSPNSTADGRRPGGARTTAAGSRTDRAGTQHAGTSDRSTSDRSGSGRSGSASARSSAEPSPTPSPSPSPDTRSSADDPQCAGATP